MNKLEYKGYKTNINVSFEDNNLYGKIEEIVDLVTFESDTIAGIREEFKSAVDEYLAFCESVGKKPEKPYTAEKCKIIWGNLIFMRNATDIFQAIKTDRTKKDYIFVLNDVTYKKIRRILERNAVSLRHYSRPNAVLFATKEMQNFFKTRSYVPANEVWIFPINDFS